MYILVKNFKNSKLSEEVCNKIFNAKCLLNVKLSKSLISFCKTSKIPQYKVIAYHTISC